MVPGQLPPYRLARGSKASRKPSPMKLTAFLTFSFAQADKDRAVQAAARKRLDDLDLVK